MMEKYDSKNTVKSNSVGTEKESIILKICVAVETAVFLLLMVNLNKSFLRILLGIFYVIMLFLLVSYIRKARQTNEMLLEKLEAENKAANAELEKKKQQLLALENQINPHFYIIL